MCQKHARLIEITTPATPESPVDASPGNDPAELLRKMVSDGAALPPGVDLEAFMDQRMAEVQAIARTLTIQGRANTQASSIKEGDFPPSTMP